MRCREFIENYKYIKECGDMWQHFSDLKTIRKFRKRFISEQTAQQNAMGTMQRISNQGMNNFMRKGYDYKITGQFKNSETGSFTNQDAPLPDDENPSLDITTHDTVLVKLYGQQFPLKITTIIGNKYVGTDNEGKEFEFDKSQIMKKINT